MAKFSVYVNVFSLLKKLFIFLCVLWVLFYISLMNDIKLQWVFLKHFTCKASSNLSAMSWSLSLTSKVKQLFKNLALKSQIVASQTWTRFQRVVSPLSYLISCSLSQTEQFLFFAQIVSMFSKTANTLLARQNVCVSIKTWSFKWKFFLHIIKYTFISRLSFYLSLFFYRAHILEHFSPWFQKNEKLFSGKDR